MRTAQDVEIDQIRDLLVRVSPAAWQAVGAHGVVLESWTDPVDETAIIDLLYAWSERDLFPIRVVDPGSLVAVERAVGGVLFLAHLTQFDTGALRAIRRRIETEKLPVAVIGFDHFPGDYEPDTDDFRERMKVQADALGLTIVTTDELFGASQAPQYAGASTDLDAINRHRLDIGMARLDPAAVGWTEEDVRMEAERIERLPNPMLELKRQLLKCGGVR